jgi:hypothetical protein
MAKGYWIVCYKSVSNPSALSEYVKLATAALDAMGGRVIVGAKPAKTHEAGVNERGTPREKWRTQARPKAPTLRASVPPRRGYELRLIAELVGHGTIGNLQPFVNNRERLAQLLLVNAKRRIRIERVPAHQRIKTVLAEEFSECSHLL